MSSLDHFHAFNQAFLAGDAAGMNAALADNFVFSGPVPQPMPKAPYIGMMVAMKAAFPDLNNNLQVINHTGNTVLGKYMMQGTHSGPFDLSPMGIGVLEPTGKSFINPEETFTVTLDAEGRVEKMVVEVPEGGGLSGLLKKLGFDMPG